MKVGDAIYSILSNDATVGPLVLENGVYKVFPTMHVQRYSFPSVVYSIVSGTFNETKTSASRFDEIRVQIDCYASTYDQASTLDEAVRAAIDRYNNAAQTTVAGVMVKGASLINVNETLIEADNVFRVSADYKIIIDPTV